MATLILAVFLGVALLGAASSVLVVAVAQRPSARRPHEDAGLLRMTAEVHTGMEQTLVALIRELHLPRGGSDIAYGHLYCSSRGDDLLLIRSRSEIDRGLHAAIRLLPASRFTGLEYRIQQLPGDDALRARVLGLEADLVHAVRAVDGTAEIHLAATGLRQFDALRTLSADPV